MGNVLDKAIGFAVKAHSGMYRKGTTIPYIVHPMEAAAIVATMTDDEEIIAGAVLHDVVEDTPHTIEEIKEEFGETIAGYVAAESENKREDLPAESTWKIRKEETLERLKNDPIPVKMIALGDKLSNIRAIYRDYLELGDNLWDRFNQKDPKEHAWYYESIAECIEELSEYPVYQEYAQIIEKIFP